MTKHGWIERSKQNLNGLPQQVRELSKSLMPTTLTNFSLNEILGTLVTRFNKVKQLQVNFFMKAAPTFSPSWPFAFTVLWKITCSN